MTVNFQFRSLGHVVAYLSIKGNLIGAPSLHPVAHNWLSWVCSQSCRSSPSLKCAPQLSIHPHAQLALFRLPFDFSCHLSLPFTEDFLSLLPVLYVFAFAAFAPPLLFFVSCTVRPKQQNLFGKFERILFTSPIASHFTSQFFVFAFFFWA